MFFVLNTDIYIHLVNNWINHLTDRNFDLVSKAEFIEDVSSIKGFSKILQQWVKK